jgi:hypothetical protein
MMERLQQMQLQLEEILLILMVMQLILVITKNYAAISFVYVDATAGWRSVDTSNVVDVQNPFVAATGGTITCVEILKFTHLQDQELLQ